MIHLYDGNNVLRRRLEADVSGRPLRTLLAETRGYASRGEAVIWVWDPPNSRRRRKELVPYYKAKRQATPQDVKATISLFKEILALNGTVQLEAPTYEADDVIATLVRSGGTAAFTIHSNDGDFHQLGATLNAEIALKAKVEPEWVQTYKAVVGDSSDNLKGIYLFGDKAWARSDHAALNAMLKGASLPSGDEMLEGFGLSPASAAWLRSDENLARIRAEYDVAGFFDVPPDEMTEIPRKPNPAAIEALFQRYMQ